jgi:hypothetical protein
MLAIVYFANCNMSKVGARIYEVEFWNKIDTYRPSCMEVPAPPNID